MLKKDPHALEKIQEEVDQMNARCRQRSYLSSMVDLQELSAALMEVVDKQSADKHALFDTCCARLLILGVLYEELGLDYKLNYLSSKFNFKYDLPKITRDLVTLRILSPASKLRSSIRGPRDYLGFSSDNVNHIYKALDVLSENKAGIIDCLNKQLGKKVKARDTSVCLYDSTTYAFESTDQDALWDFGFSKDKKFNEVQIVMALATDSPDLPMDYALFKGNQPEEATMVPFVAELKKKFHISQLTVVADRGTEQQTQH